MSFSEIRKFLIKMQSDEDLKKQVTKSSTADDVALIGQRLGYDFSGEDLLRFNGQKVDKVTVRKVDCLLYTSPSPRDRTRSRMPSSA